MKQEDKPSYNNIIFDSSGEMHLYWWLEELQVQGYVKEIIVQPVPFNLSDKVTRAYNKPLKKKEFNYIEKTIMNAHEYTTDFKVIWDKKAEGIFVYNYQEYNSTFQKGILDLIKCDSNYVSYIEAKPMFDQNNMTRLAVLNQKWVMDKYRTFINIIIPEKLFDSSFTPLRYLQCDKSSKLRKINYKNIVLLKNFL